MESSKRHPVSTLFNGSSKVFHTMLKIASDILVDVLVVEHRTDVVSSWGRFGWAKMTTAEYLGRVLSDPTLLLMRLFSAEKLNR